MHSVQDAMESKVHKLFLRPRSAFGVKPCLC